jgi:hypothetical protein
MNVDEQVGRTRPEMLALGPVALSKAAVWPDNDPIERLAEREMMWSPLDRSRLIGAALVADLRLSLAQRSWQV